MKFFAISVYILIPFSIFDSALSLFDSLFLCTSYHKLSITKNENNLAFLLLQTVLLPTPLLLRRASLIFSLSIQFWPLFCSLSKSSLYFCFEMLSSQPFISLRSSSAFSEGGKPYIDSLKFTKLNINVNHIQILQAMDLFPLISFCPSVCYTPAVFPCRNPRLHYLYLDIFLAQEICYCYFRAFPKVISLVLQALIEPFNPSHHQENMLGL